MKHVSIEIIQKCPNKCIHCSSVASEECSVHISKNKLLEIIDGLKTLGTKAISISGGEPFLHTELIDIVSYALSKDISVDIYTSGIMLNEFGQYSSLDNKYLKRLSNIGINKLIFNMQSLKDDIYDEFMQTNGNLPLLIESIRRAKEKKIFTEIHFVPTKMNINEIDNMINFVNEFDIDKISFLGLIPHGRARENKEKLYLDKITSDTLKQKLNELTNKKTRIGIPLQTNDSEYSCYAGKEKLYIKFDGTVYGCEAFKYIKLYDEGNNVISPDSIHDRRIEDIFMDSRYLKAEAKFIEEQQKKFCISEKCPIQRVLRCQGDV